MKVIGLTGGIGSGKSTVAQFLAELGAVILDADKIGHEVFSHLDHYSVSLTSLIIPPIFLVSPIAGSDLALIRM